MSGLLLVVAGTLALDAAGNGLAVVTGLRTWVGILIVCAVFGLVALPATLRHR